MAKEPQKPDLDEDNDEVREDRFTINEGDLTFIDPDTGEEVSLEEMKKRRSAAGHPPDDEDEGEEEEAEEEEAEEPEWVDYAAEAAEAADEDSPEVEGAKNYGGPPRKQ